nr:STE20-related kinase adapter protein alpha-like [Dermatophagoides farinae]
MNKKLGTPIGKMVVGIRRSIGNHHDCSGEKQQQSMYCNKCWQHKLSIDLNHSKAWHPKHYQQHRNPLYETKTIRIIRADHIETNAKLVIKMIDLDSSSNDDNDDQQQSSMIDVHITEINMMAKLRHPNVIQMLTSFVNDNYLWQIMPMAEYGSADQWSRPNGLPELTIALIIKDVLNGLNYLHRKGIIHRAVCGSHILIMADGTCVLTGLKYSTNVLQMGRWQTKIHQYPRQATAKLLNFLAPEILEQNLLGYNSKSDIYSLGIVCCELANGCIPFEDIVLTEMLLDKLTGNFPRPLDSTCDEIRNFPTDDPDLSIEVKEKYNLYKNRTFSSYFHMFTIEHCLNFDSSLRPTAVDLLNHQFIKQTKKCHHHRHHQQQHHHHHHKEKNSSSPLLIEMLKNLPQNSTSRANNNVIINMNNNDNNGDGQKKSIIIDDDNVEQCSNVTTTKIDEKFKTMALTADHEKQDTMTIDWIF